MDVSRLPAELPPRPPPRRWKRRLTIVFGVILLTGLVVEVVVFARRGFFEHVSRPEPRLRSHAPDSVLLAIRRLDTAPAAERAKVLEAFGSFVIGADVDERWDAAVPVLTRHLTDGNPEVRFYAAWVLFCLERTALAAVEAELRRRDLAPRLRERLEMVKGAPLAVETDDA